MSRNHQNQLVKNYSVQQAEVVLPAIGTMFEWSEDHDSSVIPVLSTISQDGSGPVNTLQILDALLANERLSEAELPGYRTTEKGKKRYNYNFRLSSLVENGIVGVVQEPIEYEIDDPTYKGNLPFEGLKPETQAVYKLLQAAGSIEPDKKWTHHQLIHLAQDLKLVGPTQVEALSAKLSIAVSAKTPRAFRGSLKKRDLRPKQYSLQDRWKEPVSDLVNRVKGLDRTGAKELKTMSEYVVETYKDNQAIKRIVFRGLMSSLYLSREAKESVAEYY